MTPRQLALVSDSWARCRLHPGLVGAVAGALGQLPDPEQRAHAVIGVVDRLHPLLARPGELERTTAIVLGERVVSTLAHRSVHEAAVVAGLEAALGPPDRELMAAWQAAFALVHEIVAALVLQPFAAPAPVGPAAVTGCGA